MTSIVDEIMRVARETRVFSEQELTVLEEVAREHVKAPEEGYHGVFVNKEGRLQGFALFGRTPLTLNTWDIYWIAVAPSAQGQGIGSRLFAAAEEKMLSTNPRHLVVRVETSSRPDYIPARALYKRCGYTEAATLRNFYNVNDSLVIFLKNFD